MAILSALLASLFVIVNVVLDLYVWVLIISAVLSWLVAFDVVNQRNRFVYVVGDFCARLTEPALRRIRRWIPTVGGLDLSFIVLILAIMFIQNFLHQLAGRL